MKLVVCHTSDSCSILCSSREEVVVCMNNLKYVSAHRQSISLPCKLHRCDRMAIPPCACVKIESLWYNWRSNSYVGWLCCYSRTWRDTHRNTQIIMQIFSMYTQGGDGHARLSEFSVGGPCLVWEDVKDGGPYAKAQITCLPFWLGNMISTQREIKRMLIIVFTNSQMDLACVFM